MPAKGDTSRLIRLGACAIGALPALASIVVPPEAWIEFFEHEGRTATLGHVAPETEHGVSVLRLMLLVCGIAIGSTAWVIRRSPDVEPVARPVPRSIQWSLLGLLALAVVLRAPRLAEGLWYDEIAAWSEYGPAGPGAIVGNWFDPANHVAHTLATWVSIELLSGTLSTELALRVPALLASLVAVVALFGIARNVLGDRAALGAAAFGAVWPVMVLEGAEARGYSMMIAASAGATWALIAALDRPQLRTWILYAVVMALGVWTHPVTALAGVGHAVVLVARRDTRRALDVIALAGILSLTLWSPLIPDMLRIREMFASGGDTPGLLGPEGLDLVLQLGGAWLWWAALPGLALVALGAVRAMREPKLRRAALLALAGLPIFVLLVALTGTWVYARFAIFAMPGAILLAAAGVDMVLERNRGAGVVALTVVAAASIGDLATRGPRQPIREAVDYVRANGPEGGMLVIGLRHGVTSVYAQGIPHDHSMLHGEDLEAKLAANPRWVVVLYPAHVPGERVALLRDAGYAKVLDLPGWIDHGNGAVHVYQR